jgi:hypothetical protein
LLTTIDPSSSKLDWTLMSYESTIGSIVHNVFLSFRLSMIESNNARPSFRNPVCGPPKTPGCSKIFRASLSSS